jgi:DNA-binding beta-propeller fold protein YncE
VTSGYLIGNDAQCVLNGPVRGCGADFDSSETLITAPLASLAKVSSGKPRLPPATPTCRSVATIPVGGGTSGDPEGLGLNPRTNTVYVAESGGTVAVIRGRTNTVVTAIGLGGFPDAVATDPLTNTIYVTNADQNAVQVISGRTNTPLASIGLGVPITGIATDPLTNTVYLTDGFEPGNVAVISGRTNTVTATIPWATSRADPRPTR